MDNEYGNRNIVMDFNGFKALNGISLKIQDGEFIAVGAVRLRQNHAVTAAGRLQPPLSGEIRTAEQVVANRDICAAAQ